MCHGKVRPLRALGPEHATASSRLIVGDAVQTQKRESRRFTVPAGCFVPLCFINGSLYINDVVSSEMPNVNSGEDGPSVGTVSVEVSV